MTQLLQAQKGTFTDVMAFVLDKEPISKQDLIEGVAAGKIVIPANLNRLESGFRPIGIGEGLRIKVNANIGTSQDFCDVGREKTKLQWSLDAGADTIMDLSTGGDIDAIRHVLLGGCPVPLGTVPLYQAEFDVVRRKGTFLEMTMEDFLEVMERQAKDGVDFMTIHAGLRLESLRRLKEMDRLTRIVSRGGGLMAAWMIHHEKENPLYEHYDAILNICREYDVTVSLGDGMRPGCLHDATDTIQMDELLTLAELVRRSRKAGVQVMVEGPGHIPLHQIGTNIQIQKTTCDGAPFYVLGPLVTDVAAGWDHITGAIGGALAGWVGADFLCYVTPSEHLALPVEEEVRRGVMAFRIAAHAADIARGLPGAREWDDRMSRARYELDWETQLKEAMDPKTARDIFESRTSNTKACSMCGSFCPMNLVEMVLFKKEDMAGIGSTKKK